MTSTARTHETGSTINRPGGAEDWTSTPIYLVARAIFLQYLSTRHFKSEYKCLESVMVKFVDAACNGVLVEFLNSVCHDDVID